RHRPGLALAGGKRRACGHPRRARKQGAAMGWQVAITDEADADLGNVVAFLAQKNPAAAERIGLELVDVIFSLDQMPNRGAPVRKRPGLRKIAHRYYLV